MLKQISAMTRQNHLNMISTNAPEWDWHEIAERKNENGWWRLAKMAVEHINIYIFCCFKFDDIN
jgi:hypothetical protein